MHTLKVSALIILSVLIYAAAVAQPRASAGEQVDNDVEVGKAVVFKSGKLRLAGSLLEPVGKYKGARPAVVLITGSGSYSYKSSFSEGEKFQFWKKISQAFQEKGFYVLLIEKRGINGSQGKWQKASLKKRARDARAAIDFLKGQPFVDKTKVGLAGHSQGGWVVQLAAATYPDDVSFIVNIAGATTSVLQQEVDNLTNDWKCDGWDDAKIARSARSLRRQLKIFKGISLVVKTNNFSRMIRYDPRKTLTKIKCPVLAIYGSTDRLVPIDKNIALMEKSVRSDLLTIVRIDGATHGFFKGALCYDPKTVDWNILPEFTEAIKGWREFRK